ncbi:polysaccharide biosynthesis protein [Pseudarthrobacter enclensis]|uniref:hypothetical protein n=1 Tax=Pseudarthrobacter enclensis TaxID=993070 RepID=UPI0011471461|nr:hypothetical protein [Pseudarthrobacter enclensis]
MAALEAGRRPAYISLLLSAMLAGLTGIRFLVLVGNIPPEEYGVLNLFTLLSTLMPLLMSIGLPLQYQRVAHFDGAKRIPSLQRTSLYVTGIATLPSFCVVLLVSRPITDGQSWFWACVYITVISTATAFSTFSSQIMLGLNLRASASLIMFLVNSGATVALLPAILGGVLEATGILGWWAFFSVISALAARRLVHLQKTMGRPRIRSVVSIREGLLSVPSQIGPWLFIFVIRYLVGINAGVEAIANYAIASTVVDMAFLVAVSLLNYFTNKVMAGKQSPMRGMLYSVPAFLVLALAASVGVAWILPLIGQDGYHLAVETLVILTAVGVVRIYITAWRSRALGEKKIHVSSAAYSLVVVGTLIAFSIWPTDSPEIYALVTLGGFIAVAASQRLSLRN